MPDGCLQPFVGGGEKREDKMPLTTTTPQKKSLFFFSACNHNQLQKQSYQFVLLVEGAMWRGVKLPVVAATSRIWPAPHPYSSIAQQWSICRCWGCGGGSSGGGEPVQGAAIISLALGWRLVWSCPWSTLYCILVFCK